LIALAAWRYAQSTYAPAGEALRLYRIGAHAQQLGLPWKASQLYERALGNDARFLAARASLAEVWMDLDQPRRARTELERSSANRPQWQRVAEYESLLEQAANARLRGALSDSAVFHQRATAVAPETEKPDVLLGEAMARSRSGDVAGAMTRYASISQGSRCRCAAMLAHAVLMFPAQPPLARRRFADSVNCFETAGDLDGVAQSWYEYGRAEYEKGERGRSVVDAVRRAVSIAQSSGNIEQEIMTTALVAEMMLELGDEEAAYAAFSRAMQTADRNDLSFISARLLNARAEYFFNKGEIMQSENFSALAYSVTRSAGMPWTITRCMIRSGKLSLRMDLPDQARNSLAQAQEQLRQFPNAALAAEVAKLLNAARNSRSRPEDSVYRSPQ
jgi:tetratricopeptide (TPR) repeat protein